MRRFVSTVLLAASLASTASAQEDSIEHRLEREFRALDRCVVEPIETDYDKPTGKPVTLVQFSEKAQKIIREHGYRGFNGSYNPNTDTIVLPIAADISEMEEMIDSMRHEVFHAVCDDKTGKEEKQFKGVIGRGAYTGPSINDITNVCASYTNQPEFTALRERLREQEAMEAVNGFARQMIAKYQKVGTACVEKQERMAATVTENNEKLRPYVDAKDRFLFGELQEMAVARLTEFGQLIESNLTYIESWKKAYDATQDHATRLQLIGDMKQTFSEHYDKTKKYDNLPGEFSHLNEDLNELYEKAADRKHEYDMGKLEEEYAAIGNEEVRKRMRQDIDDLKKSYEEFKAFKKTMATFENLGTSFGSFAESISNMSSVAAQVSNEYQIDKVLNDPDEVMARMYESMADLYFGPVTQNKFPVTNEMIQLFRSFRGTDAKRLFPKLVERAEVAFDLVKEGKDPEVVRDTLRYATSFAHKGRVYVWEDSPFEIKGTIPEIE